MLNNPNLTNICLRRAQTYVENIDLLDFLPLISIYNIFSNQS